MNCIDYNQNRVEITNDTVKYEGEKYNYKTLNFKTAAGNDGTWEYIECSNKSERRINFIILCEDKDD